jgi:hypothetical protein
MMRLGLVWLVALVCMTGSCSLFSTGEDELWVHEIIQDAPPIRDLLSECEWALLEAKFPPGDRDEAGARVTSGWQKVLHPFSKNGRRYQGILEIEPMGELGVCRVSARVRVQANKEVHRPLDEAYAQWESTEDDAQRARTLLHHLLGRISDPGPSDDFYRRKPWRTGLDK